MLHYTCLYTILFHLFIVYFCIIRGLEALLHLKIVFCGKMQYLYCCIFFLILSNAFSALLKQKNSVPIAWSWFKACFWVAQPNLFCSNKFKTLQLHKEPRYIVLSAACVFLTAVLFISACYFPGTKFLYQS